MIFVSNTIQYNTIQYNTIQYHTIDLRKEWYVTPEHWVKSVQSALSDLLTTSTATSATHGTLSRPSTKHGLILIGLELNTNARESFEHC